MSIPKSTFDLEGLMHWQLSPQEIAAQKQLQEQQNMDAVMQDSQPVQDTTDQVFVAQPSVSHMPTTDNTWTSYQAQIDANNQKIASLKSELAQIQSEYADEDAMDRALAANRAEMGDTSTAMAHLNRIDTRRAQAGAKASDTANTIDDLQYKLTQTRRQMAYSDNRADLEQLADQEDRYEQQIIKLGGTPSGKHVGLPGDPEDPEQGNEQNNGSADTTVNTASFGSVGDAAAWVTAHAVKGEDGKLRLSKSDLDAYKEAIKGIPNYDKQDAVQQQLKELESNKTVEEYNSAAQKAAEEYRKKLNTALGQITYDNVTSHKIGDKFTVNGIEFEVGTDKDNNYVLKVNNKVIKTFKED